MSEDRRPSPRYDPIIPNSDEEAELKKRVFDVLYSVRRDVHPLVQLQYRDLIEDLWREFVFRESWYKGDNHE